MISLNATLTTYHVVRPKYGNVPIVEMVLAPQYERGSEELMHETGSLFEAVFLCTELDLLGVDVGLPHPRVQVAIDTVQVRPPKESVSPSLKVRVVCRLNHESYRLAPRIGQKIVVMMELVQRLERTPPTSPSENRPAPSEPKATPPADSGKAKRSDWRAEIETILTPKEDEKPTDPPTGEKVDPATGEMTDGEAPKPEDPERGDAG